MVCIYLIAVAESLLVDDPDFDSLFDDVSIFSFDERDGEDEQFDER